MLEPVSDSFSADGPSFVGREREVDEIEQRLAERRWVTLTGADGIGKTRLALEVAGDMLGVVGHGVWLVELAGLLDSSLVLQAVVSALGLREEPGRPLLDTLMDYLRPKQTLLVMDCCEHLLEGCARLSQALLEACPHLSILATSREPFDVTQAAVVSVASLAAPDLERLPAWGTGLASALTEYDSVRLLSERARAVQPRFELTSDTALAAAQICRRLDGIPLAIELVAACTAHLGVNQIARRLGEHWQLLTGGQHVALPRDRTLGAAIDWSYRQLSENEQMLLRRLAVFRGGWTLEAAEAVCWGRGLETDRVADLLGQLAARSFVKVDHPGGSQRYSMLEPIRRYGRDRLLDSGETGWVQGRLLDFFLQLAEQAESRLQSVEQAAWLDRLQVEYGNLRAALEWGQAERSNAEAGLRLAGALWGLWLERGQWSEGRWWLESSLMGTAGGSSARAKAFNAAGHLAFAQGDLATAQLFYEQALAIRRGVGDKRGVVESLRSLGRVARALDNLPQAVSLAEEGWAVSSELGDNETVAASLYQLACVLERQGQAHKAAGLFQESLRLWLGVNNTMRMAGCLIGLSAVLLQAGQPERVVQATRLLGAASALLDTIGSPLSVSGRADYGQRLAAAKALLAEPAFAQAWSEGRGMTREQVIAFALRV